MSAAGTISLAGCVTGTEESGEVAEGIVDKTWSDVTNVEPDQWQLNPYNPTNSVPNEWAAGALCDRFLRVVVDEDEYEYRIVSDFEWEDDTLRLEIDNGHVWHGGDDVTAHDVEAQLLIEEHIGHVMWDYIEDIAVVDETTLELDLPDVNHEVFEQLIAEQRLWVKRDIYEEWLDELENVADDGERDEVLGELLDWRLEPDEFEGNGPFQIADINSERVLLERFDGYPWAENVNFSNMDFRTILEEGVVVESIISGELDGHHMQNWEREIREQLPDGIKRVMVQGMGGYSIDINTDADHLEHREVRQAIAYLINRGNIEENIPDNVPTPVPCGLTEQGNVLERQLGDEVEAFNTYSPRSVDEEAASELLEEAGYTMEDGMWVDEDGETLNIELLGPTWGVMSTTCETIHSQLERAGIDADLTISEPATFEESFQTGDYDMRLGWWALGSETPAPWFSFRDPFSDAYERSELNYPEEVEVPWPPGEETDTRDVNVEDAVSELGQATSEDETTEITRELAWVWNQELPKIPLTERFETPWVNTNEWDTVEDQEPNTRELVADDPRVYIHTVFEWWPRMGFLQAPE